MLASMQRLRKGVHGVWGRLAHGLPVSFDPHKRALIDTAFGTVLSEPHSFADLGGVWRVEAGYTFYTLDHYPIDRACLVDTDFTPTVTAKARRYPQLELLHGNFGDPAVAEAIGHVDAIFLFDVLLHQVAPDWDAVLRMYARATDCFLVFNQQFVKSDTTVRLADLGKDAYFRHVKMDPRIPHYRDFWERPEEIHPQHGRRWRDIHNVWQWGITDTDLESTMTDLGFQLRHKRNWGRFSSWESFENHAFIFAR